MKNGWICSGVVCQYYKCENQQKISCVGADLHLHITFATREEKKRFKQMYCDKKCDSCPVYRAIEKDPD